MILQKPMTGECWRHFISQFLFLFFQKASFPMTNFDVKSIVFPWGSCNQLGRKRKNQRKEKKGIIYFLSQTQNSHGLARRKVFVLFFFAERKMAILSPAFYRMGFVFSNFMVLRSKCWVWGDISRKSNCRETYSVILYVRA